MSLQKKNKCSIYLIISLLFLYILVNEGKRVTKGRQITIQSMKNPKTKVVPQLIVSHEISGNFQLREMACCKLDENPTYNKRQII
jgi:hypothetical protein